MKIDYNENDFRADIIKKFLAVPILGENYIDYHTDAISGRSLICF